MDQTWQEIKDEATKLYEEILEDTKQDALADEELNEIRFKMQTKSLHVLETVIRMADSHLV